MVVSEYWLYLWIAIPFSALGTLSMKLSEGLKKWKPAICVGIFYLISFTSLTVAIKGIDMSVGYAIWSAIGTLLIVIIGRFFLNETITFKKLMFILLIILGSIGVHLAHALQ